MTDRDFASPRAETHYPPDRRIEIVHLDAYLRVRLEERTIEGVVTHTVRARSEARELVLDAVDFDDLQVENDALRWRYDGERLHLRWEEPLAADEERQVRVRYRVTDPASGVFFSRPTEADPDAPRFIATDHETERARHWLPTVDHPSVRPTLALHLRADASFTILANGVYEREESHDDGTKTAHWRLDHPCPSYLTCFCIGELARWDGGEYGGVPIACFGTAPITPEILERSFGKTHDMMAWLTDRLEVPFPYPKYFQFAVPGIGGAMENISLVSWDDRWLLDETVEPEHRDMMDAINLHEMAHTWFGDHVVIRDFAHAWLKESWATYLESCWLGDTQGRDAMEYDLWVLQKQYFEETKEKYHRPIVTRRYDSSWHMFDRHLYPGGAWRIHMLRRMLGDRTFWRAVTIYLERFAERTVETDDFRRVLEEVSGRPLDQFFEQWLRSPGFPRLKVQFRWEGEQGVFEIEQTQVDEEKGIPCFTFDLDLAWTARGETTRRTVRVERQRTVAAFSMPREPEVLRVDPDGSVLHDLDFDPGEPCLRAQLASEDVRGRIQAGIALAKSGRRSAIEAVRNAFRGEAFWGVKVEWAGALGEARSEAALEAVLSLLGDEEEPRAIRALLDAAGKYRDARVVDAVSARIDRGLRPRAAEAAATALGKQRHDAPLERLVSLSAERGWGGFAQSGALRGLGETRREEALDVLIDRARTADSRARGAAAEALGELAKGLRQRPRERALEALEDLLRAPDHRQRQGAAKGLVAAGARESVPALEAYRATLTQQEAASLDRDLAELRSGKGESDALRMTIEELEAELRRLGRRVDDLEGDGAFRP